MFHLIPTGLLTAVRNDHFRVVNYRELLFNDCGDRVAQLLHVELATPISQFRNNDIQQEILIVNTHLLFPHDSTLCLVRLHQVTSVFHLPFNILPLYFYIELRTFFLLIVTIFDNKLVCVML